MLIQSQPGSRLLYSRPRTLADLITHAIARLIAYPTQGSLFTRYPPVSAPQPHIAHRGHHKDQETRGHIRCDGAISQQFIIKFKSDTMACDAGGIASVSSATKVPLRHVRPMSPDTCVVQQFADNAEGLSHEQERLTQHPAIEWLVEDRMMHSFLRIGEDSRFTVVEPSTNIGSVT
jgi:hypothetical protein